MSASIFEAQTKKAMNSADQFEAIVSDHYEPLYKFAMSLTRSESDARDLTQHAFYVWATKGHQLRDISKVKTWLFTTLHRAFLEARRRQIRFPQHHLEEVSEQLPALCPEPASQSDWFNVLSALAKVDEVYQAAVALCYLEDYSYKDIAGILDVPVGTVKSRIFRGITQLREILLPGDSLGSVRGKDEIPSAPTIEESAAPFEKIFPLPHRRPQVAGEVTERCHDEWDLSAPFLGEQFGAARIINRSTVALDRAGTF
jgi:RNA polymerase sigma-70 factor (ECF subfamily)